MTDNGNARMTEMNELPTLDDVYRKFGEVAEAAQLLETELGTMLFEVHASSEQLFSESHLPRAFEIFRAVDRNTLGQLIKNLSRKAVFIGPLETLLSKALEERNRLCHSFYREHNFRRNTIDGRKLMLEDLETIHATLLAAYKAVVRVSGLNLDALEGTDLNLPTEHVRI